MKNLFILFLMLFAYSCNDEMDAPEVCSEFECELVGEWQWTHTYGTIAGNTWTPESTGMTKGLKVSEDLISFYEDGSQVGEYIYEIFQTDTIFNDNIIRSFITYNNNTRWYELEGTDLVMRDLCVDCYDDFYVKE